MKHREDLQREYLEKPLPLLVAIAHLLLIVGLAILWNLGNLGLIDETEPLFAEASRQMTLTGDWITPYYNNATRFDKPPLVYWLMAIAYKLIGVNEWAVRLPSALAAIALILFSFFTLYKLESIRHQSQILEKTPQLLSQLQQQLPWLLPWLAATMMALTPQIIAWARVGVSDMLLSGCMGGALLAFFLGYVEQDPKQQATQQPLSGWYLAFYILSALAVLTKGPVGIVLPGLIIVSFTLYLGNWRQVWREMRPLWGGLLFLVIALPWFVLVTLANGQAYLDSFFGYHNIERFTSVVNRHSAPWYFYFIVVLVGFAPWSFFLPLAIAKTQFWRRRLWKRQPRLLQFQLFAFFWFICIFGFFTIAVTKLPSYVLPLMPAAAILTAYLWYDQDQLTPQTPQLGLWLSGVSNLIFAIALAGTLLYLPQWLGNDASMPNLPLALVQSGLLIRGSVIVAIAALIGVILLLRHRWRWIWGLNFITLISLLIVVIMPLFFLLDGQRQLPLRQIADTINQQRQPQEELVTIGFEKPSLVFYTQNSLEHFQGIVSGSRYLRQLATTKPTPPTVLILTNSRRLERLELQPQEYQLLTEKPNYRLIRITKDRLQRLPQL